MKKNLKVDDRVRFINTGSDYYDGLTGSIAGKSFDVTLDHYIVIMDIPLWGGWKAISMTEACLELI